MGFFYSAIIKLRKVWNFADFLNLGHLKHVFFPKVSVHKPARGHCSVKYIKIRYFVLTLCGCQKISKQPVLNIVMQVQINYRYVQISNSLHNNLK